MKKWTNPEVVDLKISLTAGVYGGVRNARRPVGTPNASYHTPAPTPSFHQTSPTPFVTEEPASQIWDITDFVDEDR